MATSLDELKRCAVRFEEQTEDMKGYLEAGSERVVQIRDIIGADSDLGATLNALNDAMLAAKDNAFTSLTTIKDIIIAKIDEQNAAASEADSEYQTERESIAGIEFRTA